MEEKKEGKEVSNKDFNPSEQLVQALNESKAYDARLVQENNQLRQLVNRLDMSNLFKRIDYLRDIIVNLKDCPYITEEFRKECGIEFMEILSKGEPEESKDE